MAQKNFNAPRQRAPKVGKNELSKTKYSSNKPEKEQRLDKKKKPPFGT